MELLDKRDICIKFLWFLDSTLKLSYDINFYKISVIKNIRVIYYSSYITSSNTPIKMQQRNCIKKFFFHCYYDICRDIPKVCTKHILIICDKE